MDNVSFIEVKSYDDVIIYAIIDRGNGEYTSMLKSTYDEMIAQQGQHLTENPTEDVE